MTPRTHRRAGLQLEPLEDRQLLAAQILLGSVNHLLAITGTPGADHVHVSLQNGAIVVNLTSDGVPQQALFSPAQVGSILFHGLEGDDRFLNDLAVPCTVYGGAGHDYLEGHSAVDRIFGEDGNDILVGFGGNDRVRGGAGNDLIFGMVGQDFLYGDLGADYLYGGTGKDQLKDRYDYRDGLSDGPLGQVALPYSDKLQDYLNPPVPPSTGLTALETAIINLTNQQRQLAGLAPLTLDTQLLGAARHHSQNMARFSRMAHVLPEADLPELVNRLNYYGYRYWTAGENIAWNYPSAESVVTAWMNSPGHRANILNPDFNEIGVGIGYNSRGEPYYCQVFGREQ